MKKTKKSAAKRVRPRSIAGKLKQGITDLIPGAPITPASLIDGDTRKRLDRFCEAHDGADPDRVVVHAVNDYITRNLDVNPGVSDRFNSSQP